MHHYVIGGFTFNVLQVKAYEAKLPLKCTETKRFIENATGLLIIRVTLLIIATTVGIYLIKQQTCKKR
jgi:hypothetical protein